MDSQLELLIREIHAGPWKAVLFVTGGGAQAPSWLLSVPGASSTVLEVVVPYSRGSLMQLLGGQEPEQYCSPETALALAKAAFQRAATLSSFGTPILGVGATCALTSEPPKRGEHRLYVALHSCSGSGSGSTDGADSSEGEGEGGSSTAAAAAAAGMTAAVGSSTLLRGLKLAKGRRSRLQEEEVASRLVIQMLGQACGAPLAPQLHLHLLQPTDHPHQQPGDQLEQLQQQQQQPQAAAAAVEDEPLQALLSGRVRCVEYSGGRVFVDAPRGGPNRVYLPGSFNPLHEGHKRLLQVAVAQAGPDAEGCFELTVMNADKGALRLDDIKARVSQFQAAGLPVVVTTACLLVDKARLLPGSTFVVGWDTAVRIVMPKYYGDSDTAMQLVLSDIRHMGCHFMVAGRLDEKGDGSFKTLADIQLPEGATDLFKDIPEDMFRSDVSSTALRASGRGLQSSDS